MENNRNLVEYREELENGFNIIHINDQMFGEEDIVNEPLLPNFELVDIPIPEILDFFFDLEMGQLTPLIRSTHEELPEDAMDVDTEDRLSDLTVEMENNMDVE